jgi:peptide/nickel transport system ATP-binding protein
MKPNEQPVLLDVKNICVDYLAGNGTVHAVCNVSFTLRRGEILGLAGESGSGKSTLAYAIAHLLRPPAVITAGEALYFPNEESSALSTHTNRPLHAGADKGAEGDGIDVLRLSSHQLRAFRWNELSIVFQSAMNALNPVMTISAQIIDVLQAHQPRRGMETYRRRARELLEIVGIAPDRLKSYPHELSGGMRQRAVIAIALALKPDLIIMDEPTTALDVVVQREILELISSLCKETGTSLIFITHDLSLLLELADKIAVMYAGKLVEYAPKHDLDEHPRHPYTYGLLNSFPTMYGPRQWMTGIPGTPPDLRAVPPGCPFVARCPFAFAPCASVVPPLVASTPDAPEQLTACHLYNPALNEKIPEYSAFARGYEMLAERSSAR